jgi:hypothetical protein
VILCNPRQREGTDKPDRPRLCRLGKLADMAEDVVVPIRFRQKPASLGESPLTWAGTPRSKKQWILGQFFAV